MVKAVVIPRHPGSAVQVRDLAGPDEIELVTGGWARPLQLERLSSTIWVNEAALLERGGFNARATALCWFYASPNQRLRPVLGDVVLAGPVDDPVMSLDMPEPVLSNLVEPHHFVVQASQENRESWSDTHACFDNIFDAAIWCMIIGLTGPRGWDMRINPDDPHGDRCDHSPFKAVV